MHLLKNIMGNYQNLKEKVTTGHDILLKQCNAASSRKCQLSSSQLRSPRKARKLEKQTPSTKNWTNPSVKLWMQQRKTTLESKPYTAFPAQILVAKTKNTRSDTEERNAMLAPLNSHHDLCRRRAIRWYLWTEYGKGQSDKIQRWIRRCLGRQKLWIQRVGTDTSMFDEYDLCRQSTSLIEWHTSISFRLERFDQLLLRQCRVGRNESESQGERGHAILWWKIRWIFINVDLCFNLPSAVCSGPPRLEMLVCLTFNYLF
jgi:hypothetical protein